MHINADSRSALAVFEEESHATLHSSRTKEGLSLFGKRAEIRVCCHGMTSYVRPECSWVAGILNNTRTPISRFLLRRWLLYPSLNIKMISDRHDAVECFALHANDPVTDAMARELKGIKNVPKLVSRLKLGTADLSCWKAITKVRRDLIRTATRPRPELTELHAKSSATMR